VSRVLPRLHSLRPALFLGTGVLLFTCASGWWNWMPSAQASVTETATETGAGLRGATATATAAADEDEDGPDIEDLPQLTVSGTARVEKPADEVRIAIGVQVEAEDARTALRRNTERMNAVVEAITKTGLTDEDYETGRFRIRPEYDRRPRNASADWEPRIVGYTVTNSLDISTGRLELVGELIAAANEAGANDVTIQGFGLAEPEQYRPEVITQATRRAITDAKALAAAADLELVRILRIDANAADPRPTVDRGMVMSSARMAADAAPPIEGGDVTLTATVRIVYEVRAADG
jgi:uncharacterized protein YggE